MAQVTLRGKAVSTNGELPEVGSTAPGFTLVKTDWSDLTLADLAGQQVVLNIFMSLETPVCAASVTTFNTRAADLDNTTVVSVSADLPFAHKRFGGDQGIDHTVGGSTFRGSFPDDYGIRMADGDLAGLCARSVVVIDPSGKVTYTELVPDIGSEPDYDAAIAVLT